MPELIVAGSSFARYQIVRCIGVGGMGAVFEAMHTLLRKRVALKAMHATLGRSESSRARFLREAETVARIRHPHVVDISDVGIERGIPYLVMEYLEGEDLASLLERERRLSVQRAIDIVLPVVAGLAAVHRLGIVHRDIKPENVFLAVNPLGDTVPKLVDFGVSKDFEASSAKSAPLSHTVAGTPYYMAPEQARGSAVLDGRADQYAVGVLLYQCLAGVRPYDSESLLELIHMIDAGNCQPLRSHCPELPEGLLAAVERAMSCRVQERFESTEAFGKALAPFASEQVRATCLREFGQQHQHPSTMPPRSLSPEMLARLSAETIPSEAESAAAVAAMAVSQVPRRSVSGVRARDTEPTPDRPRLRTRLRRAFLWAAGITGVLLLAGYLLFVRIHGGAAVPPPVVKLEPAAASPVSAPPAAPVAPASLADDPAPASEDSRPVRRSGKGRRQEPAVKPSPVDIQLSR